MHGPFLRSALLALLSTSALMPAHPAWADAQYPLPANRDEALGMEARNALPLTPFYDPPVPLPQTPPGTLLRSEPFDGYDLPKGARAMRILYLSRARDGSAVAASGVVLVPAGEAPAGGWPVIAWAHGTSGVARMCAPSLMRDVEYGSEGLMPMVAAGFAIIATDYAGLGTPGPHQYDDKIPQTNDVVFSIPAAHAAVPSLGRRWVLIGHSQGGVVAWGVAEKEADLNDPDYAGGISVAGDMDYDFYFDHDARTYTTDVAMYWPLTAFGIKASYPSFDPAQLLTPPFLQRYPDITTKGCWYYGYAAAGEVSREPAVRDGWREIPEVKQFIEDGRSAVRPIKGPLLVLAGDDDLSVDIGNIKAGVARACALGLPIEFVHRPGLDHDPLMEKTIDLQLAWVRDRLADKPWQGATCPH